MYQELYLVVHNNALNLLLDSQARALDAVLKEVNLRFGKGSIMKLGSTPTKVYAPLRPSSARLTLCCPFAVLLNNSASLVAGRPSPAEL